MFSASFYNFEFWDSNYLTRFLACRVWVSSSFFTVLWSFFIDPTFSFNVFTVCLSDATALWCYLNYFFNTFLSLSSVLTSTLFLFFFLSAISKAYSYIIASIYFFNWFACFSAFMRMVASSEPASFALDSSTVRASMLAAASFSWYCRRFCNRYFDSSIYYTLFLSAVISSSFSLSFLEAPWVCFCRRISFYDRS